MPTSDNLVYALVLFLCVSALMGLGQWSVFQLNPNAANTLSMNGTMFCELNKASCTGNLKQDTWVMDGLNPENNIPDTAASTSPTTGNLWTDSPTSIKSWFSKVGFGLTLAKQFMTAPTAFLGVTALPQIMKYMLATIWLVILTFLLAMLFWGR